MLVDWTGLEAKGSIGTVDRVINTVRGCAENAIYVRAMPHVCHEWLSARGTDTQCLPLVSRFDACLGTGTVDCTV